MAVRNEGRLPYFGLAFIVNHTMRTDLFVKVGSELVIRKNPTSAQTNSRKKLR